MEPFGIKKEEDETISKEDLSAFISIKDFKKYEDNPFYREMVLKSKKTYSIEKEFTIKKENFILGKLKSKKEISHFTKVYKTDSNIGDLTPTAAKLLLYIIYEKLSYNFSAFYLNIGDIQNNVKIASKETIYNCLVELLKEKYIAKHDESNIYWINPTKCYKGDRINITM
jgi:hypothetical protein